MTPGRYDSGTSFRSVEIGEVLFFDHAVSDDEM